MGAARDDPRSDEELVASGNAGDEGALAAIYWRYRDWAARIAVRYVDGEAAQDVVQEAFIYLFGKFPGFRLRAKLTTVLYPAVRNSALALKRRKAPEHLGEGHEQVAPIPPGSSIGSTRLGLALTRLPDGQREVLLMRVVDDMSVLEIALALGIPEGTVKSRLHHGLRAMRESLGDPGSG